MGAPSMSPAGRRSMGEREEMEIAMLSQLATLAAEAALLCEVLLGAVILMLWTAIEIIGYGGLLVAIVRQQRWLVLSAPKPARDIRWGATVRAAGLRSRRLPAGRPQTA
jgi:hypothetical protein